MGLADGQDNTEAFFGLHLYEVLERPQYKRLQVGVIKGEQPRLHGKLPGQLSEIPYAEPSWLSKGYHSPYFKDVSLLEGAYRHHHFELQQTVVTYLHFGARRAT